MAAALNFDHKKKSSHHAYRNSRDESSGMSASTKRHFLIMLNEKCLHLLIHKKEWN